MVVRPQCGGIEDHVKREVPAARNRPWSMPSDVRTHRTAIDTRDTRDSPGRPSRVAAALQRFDVRGHHRRLAGRMPRSRDAYLPGRASPRHQSGGLAGMRRSCVRGAASTTAPNRTSRPTERAVAGARVERERRGRERASAAATTCEEDRRRENSRPQRGSQHCGPRSRSPARSRCMAAARPVLRLSHRSEPSTVTA